MITDYETAQEVINSYTDANKLTFLYLSLSMVSGMGSITKEQEKEILAMIDERIENLNNPVK